MGFDGRPAGVEGHLKHATQFSFSFADAHGEVHHDGRSIPHIGGNVNARSEHSEFVGLERECVLFLPFGVLNTRASQVLVDQSMEVVVSAALPRFSMENQALATSPGRPLPVLVAVPSGPSMSKPRVLRTSTGTRTVALVPASPARSTFTSNQPSSSPNAVLGTVDPKPWW